jgi:hypothetical protein
MNSATASLSSFSTNENKALLWSVLHGSGKFVGIPDFQQQTIQEMFDSTIREMSEHYRKSNQPVNLNVINKEAVVVICNKIETIKQRQQQQQQQPPYNNQHIPQQQQLYQKKQQQVPQLETIYRAEDLHKERQNAFQNELKKKEEEMSSILKLKKPEEINFTDDVYDKPIGNDMERLLAEALASRERELEQIKNTAFTAPNPDSKSSAGPSPTNQEFITYKTVVREKERDIEKNAKENEKRVSFGSQLHIIENRENNQIDYEMGENSNENSNENIGENVDENSDISFIFNKLKKIKTRKNEKYENENNEYVSSINNNNNYNNNVDENNNTHIIFKMSQDIDKMSEDIKYIKNTLVELADKINKLCDHEK